LNDHESEREFPGTKTSLSYEASRDPQSCQMAEIGHEAVVLCYERFIDRRSRIHDQRLQAARRGDKT